MCKYCNSHPTHSSTSSTTHHPSLSHLIVTATLIIFPSPPLNSLSSSQLTVLPCLLPSYITLRAAHLPSLPFLLSTHCSRLSPCLPVSSSHLTVLPCPCSTLRAAHPEWQTSPEGRLIGITYDGKAALYSSVKLDFDSIPSNSMLPTRGTIIVRVKMNGLEWVGIGLSLYLMSLSHFCPSLSLVPLPCPSVPYPLPSISHPRSSMCVRTGTAGKQFVPKPSTDRDGKYGPKVITENTILIYNFD